MRNLALVLLLLNIVFLSWQLVLLPKQNIENAENTKKTLPTKPIINSHPIIPSIENVAKEKKPPICFQAGPYTDKKKVDELINILKNNKNLNIKIKVQTSQTRVLKSIWVYLPAKSKQAARNTIKSLKQAGFKDYMITKKGKLNNIISLGFYNSPLYAELRIKKLKSKGYKNVEAQKSYKDVTKYMLNVKMPANQQSLFVIFFQESFPEQLLELVACE